MNIDNLPPEYRKQVQEQLDNDYLYAWPDPRGARIRYEEEHAVNTQERARVSKRKQRTPKPPPALDETVLTLPTNWRELVALTMAAHKLTQIEVIEEADYLYVYYASARTVDPRTVAEWFRDSGLPCYRVGMDGLRDEMYAVMRKAA